MNVIVKKLNNKKLRLRDTNVRESWRYNSEGRRVRVLCADVNSPTFDDDLTYVFQRNIARARRENKKLFGSADGPKFRKKSAKAGSPAT
jgi:hypothetical protein